MSEWIQEAAAWFGCPIASCLLWGHSTGERGQEHQRGTQEVSFVEKEERVGTLNEVRHHWWIVSITYESDEDIKEKGDNSKNKHFY